MQFNDPSLYAVTPREMSSPFTGGLPYSGQNVPWQNLPWQNVPWQNVPRIPPFQNYGMLPFIHGMQPQPFIGMQPPWLQPFIQGMQPLLQAFGYAMQPFHPLAQLGTPPFQGYPPQPVVPPSFAPGYGTPYPTAPWLTPQTGGGSLPFTQPLQGGQRPIWY